MYALPLLKKIGFINPPSRFFHRRHFFLVHFLLLVEKIGFENRPVEMFHRRRHFFVYICYPVVGKTIFFFAFSRAFEENRLGNPSDKCFP